jgi:hypothetical protein
MSRAVIDSEKSDVQPPSPYEVIFALEGSLREFPLEADLEEERLAERNRECELDETADV